MSSIDSPRGPWPKMGPLPHHGVLERTDMCDNGISSKLSLRVNAAELASLVESALPVISKLAQIAATSEFSGTRADISALRDWVDHAYVSLVELCEAAADRVDVELNELDAVPPTDRPPS